MSGKVIAILCSDIHLQARAPVARSPEGDWLEAMARPLRELKALKHKHGDVPVLCAGDIFDRWNCPPAVINMAIREMPVMWAIPGQHDLPYHDYHQIQKSAYWTLVEAGKVVNLEAGCRRAISGSPIVVTPFPWGTPLETVDRTQFEDRVLHVALIHRYVWKKNYGYTGAPEEAKIGAFRAVLSDYDVAVFGDNHKGFLIRGDVDAPAVLNCGGFMRRKIDEVDYEPTVGFLYADGTIIRHKLNCGEDKFIDVVGAAAVVERALEMGDFVAELAALGTEGLDFVEAVERFLMANKITGRIRDIAMGAVRK